MKLPQGSVLGPTLWDIGYDFILRMLEKRCVSHLAYADDTMLLLAAETIKEMRLKIQSELKNPQARMKKAGLLLNANQRIAELRNDKLEIL